MSNYMRAINFKFYNNYFCYNFFKLNTKKHDILKEILQVYKYIFNY